MIWKKADALFKDMGLTTTDAVRMFLTQCVNLGSLPFAAVEKTNTQTLEALANRNEKAYNNIDELSKLWK